MGYLRLITVHFIALGGVLRSGLISKGRFSHDEEFFHLLLKLLINGLLVLNLFLVHFDFLSLDGQLLADGIRILRSDLPHLTVFEQAFKVLDTALQSRVFFLKNHMLLADSEELGLSLVELVSKRLQFSLLLLVCAN